MTEDHQTVQGRHGGRRARRVRRGARVSSAVASALVIAVLSAPMASAKTVGDPQPEMAQFNLGFSGSGTTNSGVVLPDGNTLLVSSGGGSTLTTCELFPGGRSCHARNTLDSFGGDGLYGSSVVSTGGEGVDVVSEDDGASSGTDFPIIVWTSTNDGANFSAPSVVSTLYGVNSATYAGGQIVIADNDPHSGLVVQSVSPGSVQTNDAVVSSDEYDATVSSYDGGVLVAADDSSTAKVWYASSGSNFNLATSYSLVGSFTHQIVAGLSGGTLLTVPSNSLTTAGIISFFNGSNFGAAHKVPDSKAGDDGYFALATSGPSELPTSTSDTGVAHVFFEGRRDGYDEMEESTSNGTSWTPLTVYGSAIKSEEPVSVLGPSGAGVVFESDASPQLAQPVMNPQSVHISLSKSKVTVGTKATVKGQTSFHINGLSITLQKEDKGDWYTVGSTHESAAGAFTFSVPGATDTYRAIVADDPGYLQFGYSNDASLTAIPKK